MSLLLSQLAEEEHLRPPLEAIVVDMTSDVMILLCCLLWLQLGGL